MIVPYAVVRVNNLPLGALAPLTRSADVESAAALLGRTRDELDAMKDGVCDLLFDLAAENPDDYRNLIELKRSIFKGTGLDGVVSRHAALLRKHGAMSPWLEQALVVLGGEAALRDLFERETDNARRFAQTVLTNPHFLQAMVMTRAQGYRAAIAYAQDSVFKDKKTLNDEETIYRYLTRAITKVSPFSAFTSVGFAPVAAGQSAGTSMLGGRATMDRFSLDRAGFFKLFEKFLLRHKRHFLFRLTDNCVERDDGHYYYLFMDRPDYYAYRTTFLTTKAKSLGIFAADAAANGWLPWETIATRLPAGAAADELLKKWLSSGFLSFAPRLEEESPHLLMAFLTIAERIARDEPAAQATVAILARMAQAYRGLDGAGPEALLVLVKELHEGMAALSQDLGYPLIKTAGLVYHDSYLPDLAPISREEITGFGEQIQEFLSHYLGYNFHSGFSDAQLSSLRAAMADGLQLGVFEFYDLVQRCAARGPGAGEAPQNTLPILQLYNEVWQRRGEQEIVLGQVALPARQEHTAFAAYGHLWNGQFILNNVDSGYLRCFSRFFTFTDDPSILEACRTAYGGELEAAYDFYDTFGFNTAHRPRIAGNRIWLDASVTRQAGDIALSDLAVAWPEGDAYPILLNGKTQSRVDLRQTGLFTRELYPKILEMLLRLGMANAPCYFAFRFGLHKTVVDMGGETLVKIPRVRYRDIILSRAQWWIPKSLLPMREPNEVSFEYFKRLDAWRRQHGIPQRAFVRRHNAGKVLDRDVSNGKKPLFVDFAAPIMTRMIGRVFNTGFDTLSMEEMIPDHDDQRASHDDQRYANEIIFELGSNTLL